MATTLQQQANPFSLRAPSSSRDERSNRRANKGVSTGLQRTVDRIQTKLSKSKKDLARVASLQEIAQRLQTRDRALTQQLAKAVDVREKRRLTRELRVIAAQLEKTARLIEERQRG